MVLCPTTRVGVSVRCSIAGAAGACGVPRTAKLAKRAFIGGNDVELAVKPGFHHRHGYVCAAQGSESERGSPATAPPEEEPLMPRQASTSNAVEPAGSIDWVMTALCFFFPALGGAMFGYDIGATSGALLSIMSSETSGIDWYNLTAFQEGLVVSLSLAGALFGSLAALLGGDRIGRRKELMFAAIIYGVAALVTSTSPTLEGLLLGRSLYGLGIGLAMHAAPAYVAETAPPKVRGLLISLKEAFIVGGILLGYLVSYLCIEQVGGWRLMYGVPIIPAAALLAGMAWLPPSPRWLVLSGAGSERAAAALRRVRGRACGDEDAIALEVQAMEESVGTQGKEDSSSLTLLLSPEYRRPLLIGVLLMLFQQVSGQPSVVYYAASIFQDAGLTSEASATGGSVALGVFKLLMTVLAVSTVDTWGRRPLLLGGVSGIVVALLVLSSTSAFGAGSTMSIWASLIALMLYVGCYQVSFGPISWLLVGEVFPLVVRGQAIAVATFTNFGSNFAVSLLFPVLRENVGPSATYLMFAGVATVALAYIYMRVPETKGKSLEEIEALWKS